MTKTHDTWYYYKSVAEGNNWPVKKAHITHTSKNKYTFRRLCTLSLDD